MWGTVKDHHPVKETIGDMEGKDKHKQRARNSLKSDNKKLVIKDPLKIVSKPHLSFCAGFLFSAFLSSSLFIAGTLCLVVGMGVRSDAWSIKEELHFVESHLPFDVLFFCNRIRQ